MLSLFFGRLINLHFCFEKYWHRPLPSQLCGCFCVLLFSGVGRHGSAARKPPIDLGTSQMGGFIRPFSGEPVYISLSRRDSFERNRNIDLPPYIFLANPCAPYSPDKATSCIYVWLLSGFGLRTGATRKMQIDVAAVRPETQTPIVAQVVFLVKAFMPVPPEKCKLFGLVGLRSSATIKMQIGVAPVRPEKQTTIAGLPPETCKLSGRHSHPKGETTY